MLSRRNHLAALAAVTAALAAAVPAAGASAASTPAPSVDPTVCQLMDPNSLGPFASQMPGGASLKTTLTNAGATVGCAAPAAQPSQRSWAPGQPWLLPMVP